MRLGAAFTLIAAGAVLRFAVSRRTSGVDLHMIGVILMVVGVVGGVITLLLMTTRRRTDVYAAPGRTTVVEPTRDADLRY